MHYESKYFTRTDKTRYKFIRGFGAYAYLTIHHHMRGEEWRTENEPGIRGVGARLYFLKGGEE